MDRQLTLQGYNKEDLKELGQGLFVPVKRSQSQSNAGPRQQAFKIARAAPRIHPLWSHLNAIRVHHYYEKLRMITRISDEEAERLDRRYGRHLSLDSAT